ncbi:MAG: PrgI family protein [Patescibacteria group bacterium]
MRQYQIPQFITVEDRVVGPLTVKQALFLAAGVMVIIGMNMIFSRGLTVFLSITVVVPLTLALAFLKWHDQPFYLVFKNGITYSLRPRVFLWKRQPAQKKSSKGRALDRPTATPSLPRLSESKLTDLAWSLDIKEPDRGK